MGVKQNSVATRCSSRVLCSAVMGWLFAVTVLFMPVPGADADRSPLYPEYRGKIALDPGHGGKVRGVRGPGGALEKDICLAIAQRLALELEPEYQVILTRSADYNIDLPDRAALANNQHADLLISIHMGAGFLNGTTGVAIYSYRPNDKDTSSQGLESSLAWESNQLAHIPAAKALAEHLAQAFSAVRGASDIRMIEAPLTVLQGAQMPAVLIEIGYLTNPGTETDLSGQAGQLACARALAQAIDRYFAAAPARSARRPQQHP